MIDTSRGRPLAQTSLVEYFRDRVESCAEQVEPRPQDETCWYVSKLLERFGRSEACFVFDNGEVKLPPLATLYRDAADAPTGQIRCLLLQQLGDLALFLGALFPGHFYRRGIDQDYLVFMGGSAYDYLAANARAGRDVFAELADRFTSIMNLVAEACAGDSTPDARQVMAVYQRWLRTRSPQLARTLQGWGVAIDASQAYH